MKDVIIKSVEDTERLGKKIADAAKPGDVIALIGDLGTGKTTLTGAIARGLGIKEPVTSPTFTLVNEYMSGRLPLFHFDAYRIENPDETTFYLIEEYFDRGGVCIIEWADQIAEILPDDAKAVFLEYGEGEGERIYKCTF